uniref:Uncharacterized protein n=1 Tax=Cacopsylla melanoneura TaxID=428564 RepID=A0A8D9BWD5_9HEMI
MANINYLRSYPLLASQHVLGKDQVVRFPVKSSDNFSFIFRSVSSQPFDTSSDQFYIFIFPTKTVFHVLFSGKPNYIFFFFSIIRFSCPTNSMITPQYLPYLCLLFWV